MGAFLALLTKLRDNIGMRSLVFLSLLLILNNCSTQQKRVEEFEAIRIGMLKSEVLHTAGAPHWSDRYHDLDRWIYYLKPKDRQTERVVYFRNGKVVLKGERIKPTLTAEEAEAIKQPKPPTTTSSFKPSMTEEEVRAAIKKEIKKKEGKKKQPHFEEL